MRMGVSGSDRKRLLIGAETDMQLSFEVDPSAPISLQNQLVGQISTSITTGRLKAGTRLPGTRALSEQLGVSRNTVLLAYAGLAAEGFVETREGAGTYVSPASPEPPTFAARAKAAAPRAAITPAARVPPPIICDFELEGIDPDLFPSAAWRRLMIRRMQSSRFNLTRAGDPQGAPELRAALCRFLGATRGMLVEPGQVVVVSGIQQAMTAVGQMLVRPGTPLIMEAPGCSMIAPLYQRYGAEVLPVPVDADGLMVDRLPACRGGVAVVTPARHFPLGGTMPASRRRVLLDWADASDAHVFEVDFDSDFQYEGSPLPSLQTMDRHGRFIYAGSFAMTIGPGLRIGYLILPHHLVQPALEAVSLLEHAWPIQGMGAPWLDQAVLTDFIDSGGYDKHLRTLRRAYMQRRDAVVAGLARHFGAPDLVGMASGTHLAWRIPRHLPDAAACEARARAMGIAVHTLKFRTISGAETLPGWERHLLLGFAALKPAVIATMLDRFAASLR
jgi:GntR family transcriptional regulator/MocR family aminotransferase